MIDHDTGRRDGLAACGLVLAAALSLAACGSDTPPPLIGNLVDARGAHAGSFRSADDAPAHRGNVATVAPIINAQDRPR